MKRKAWTAALLLAAVGFLTHWSIKRSRTAVATVPANAAENGAVPETITFGGILFRHAAHVDRVESDCAVCHDRLFPQSVKAALNYAGRRHRTAEAEKASCAACHVEGGSAFAAANNCQRCHTGERRSRGRRASLARAAKICSG